MARLVPFFLLVIILLLAVGSPISNVRDIQPTPEATLSDTVIRSRQSPPIPTAESASSGLVFLTVFLVILFVVGAALLYFYFGANWLKQRRLTLKEQRRSPSRSSRPQYIQTARPRELPEVARYGRD